LNTALEFRDVDILFSAGAGRRGAAVLQQALNALDAGGTRAEITQKFGVVVGMAGANLKVERGEISVLMGLSGSGQIDSPARGERHCACDPRPGARE